MNTKQEPSQTAQPLPTNATQSVVVVVDSQPQPPPYPYQAYGTVGQGTSSAPTQYGLGYPLPVIEVIPVPSQTATYRRDPVKVVCHSCQAVVLTTTNAKAGIAIYGAIFALIFFGCYLGCCLLPLCVRDMYDTVHTCPNCKVGVGRFQVVKV